MICKWLRKSKRPSTRPQPQVEPPKEVEEDTIGTPVPDELATPDDEVESEHEKDLVNDGDYKNPDWTYLWDNATLDTHRLSEIDWYCSRIMDNKDKYKEVAYVGRDMAIRHFDKVVDSSPWWFIAGLHVRESGLSFKGVLHNGQQILGTGRKTTWVPKNRGPFDTWEESAVDALFTLKGYHKVTNWSIYDCLARAERFNGLGYRRKIGDKGKGEYSPYVWAGTVFHDETSKYVSDGRYDKYAKEKQLGVASIWIRLRDHYKVDI